MQWDKCNRDSREQMGVGVRSNCKFATGLCLIFLYIFAHIINTDAVNQTKDTREI